MMTSFQAYCMIDEADPQYDGLVVTVEEMPSQDDEQIILKVYTILFSMLLNSFHFVSNIILNCLNKHYS